MPEHTPAPTPSRAVYGFVMYLSFKTFFTAYLIWAVIPEQWFVALGITYLPSHYWALVVPMFLLTFLAVFAFIIYPCMGLIMTPNINDSRTIKDAHSQKSVHSNLIKTSSVNNIACCKNKSKCKKHNFEIEYNSDFLTNCIPSLEDISFTDISKKLYL